MANTDNGKAEKEKLARDQQALVDRDFDIEADINRLKRSSYVLIFLLVVLVAAFFILMILSLSGSFEGWNTTNVPAVVKVVTSIKDNLPVYREPGIEGGIIGQVDTTDRLYEIKRVPGFVRVEWGSNRSGWVEAMNIKSKAENLAVFWNLTPPALDVVLKIEIYQQDILIAGQVLNKAERGIRNVSLTIYFLDAKRQAIGSEQVSVGTQAEIPTGGSVPFNVVGKGLVNRCSYVAWEVMDFESTHLEPTPPPEGDQAAPAPTP
jgi:hypothetical protein